MADEPDTSPVTLKNEATGATWTTTRAAVRFFTTQPNVVVLDAAGRKKAHQPTTDVKETPRG